MNPRSLSIAGVLFLASSHTTYAWQMEAPCLKLPQAERPYSRVHLLEVVSSQTPVRTEYLIRACGVSVPFDSALESDLKEAGAQDNVIAAVREVAPKAVVDRKVDKGPEISVNAKDGLRYVYIPPGTFRMGCSDGDGDCLAREKPSHEVRITRGFWMGQTDVTTGAYKKYARATGKAMPDEPVAIGNRNLNPHWSMDSVPMTRVAWAEARDYCAWSGTRLPTEAEWEYAARAGTTGPRYGELNDIAWWGSNSGDTPIDADEIRKSDKANFGQRMVESGGRPHDAGLKRPNAFQLYDMLGNVWQWTADWYKSPYESSSGAETDPQGPVTGELRVLRGGSWGSHSGDVRVSTRLGGQLLVHSVDFGFRCVR